MLTCCSIFNCIMIMDKNNKLIDVAKKKFRNFPRVQQNPKGHSVFAIVILPPVLPACGEVMVIQVSNPLPLATPQNPLKKR